jgi:hypothetical protein
VQEEAMLLSWYLSGFFGFISVLIFFSLGGFRYSRG